MKKRETLTRERDGVLNSAGGVRLGQKELGEEAACMGTEADTFPGEIVEGALRWHHLLLTSQSVKNWWEDSGGRAYRENEALK